MKRRDIVNVVLAFGQQHNLGLTRKLATMLADQLLSMANGERSFYKVTPAEHEVLHLWADGYTTSYIAHLRSVSERTVERQIGSLNREFGTNNRADLVTKAKEAGLL